MELVLQKYVFQFIFIGQVLTEKKIVNGPESVQTKNSEEHSRT